MPRNTRQSLITPPFALVFILPSVVPSALVIGFRGTEGARRRSIISLSNLSSLRRNARERGRNTRQKGMGGGWRGGDGFLLISLRVNSDLCFCTPRYGARIRRLKGKRARGNTERRKERGWRDDKSRRNEERWGGEGKGDRLSWQAAVNLRGHE